MLLPYITDGPHWAIGYGLDQPYRTSADGEIWAFTDETAAREHLVASFADETVDLESVAGLGIERHERPTAECRECILMASSGEYAEVWAAHWSTIDRDGDRMNRGGIIPPVDMLKHGTEWHPTPDACTCMFD